MLDLQKLADFCKQTKADLDQKSKEFEAAQCAYQCAYQMDKAARENLEQAVYAASH